jgi:hypothetical protein
VSYRRFINPYLKVVKDLRFDLWQQLTDTLKQFLQRFWWACGEPQRHGGLGDDARPAIQLNGN